MNVGTAKTKTFQLIDLYSRSGILLDPNGTKQKDYTLKMPLFFDMAQKEISTIKKIVKQYKTSHVMPANKLSAPLYQFDSVSNTGDDQIYEATDIGAYYFEVDDVCDIEFSEEILGVWTPMFTINHTANPGTYTAYKGIMDTENKVRMTFKGGTRYNHRNRAMFGDRFSSVNRVPNYQKYVLYQIGPRFYQLNKVILKGQLTESRQYEQTADFFWEKRDTIALNWYAVGEYVIEYFAYPSDINLDVADSYEFEVDTEAQEAIVYYAAAQVLLNENNIVGDRLLNKYNTILANLNPKIANGANFVSNSLFQGTSNRLF
jgi:hypothetical protein